MARGYDDDLNPIYVEPNHIKSNEKSGSLISKTFLYMALGLLVTFAVAFGFAFALDYALVNSINNGSAEKFESLIELLYICSIGGFIIAMILSIVINMRLLKATKKVPLPLFLVYSGFMGLFLGTFVAVVDWYTIVVSIGITVLLFLSMALFGRNSKSNFIKLSGTLVSIVLCCFFLSMFWFILFLISPALVHTLDVIISFVYFFVILLFTMIDVRRLNMAAESGVNDQKTALFFAMSLYVDFIYILIRVLTFVSGTRNRN